jgi:hypothetical protein
MQENTETKVPKWIWILFIVAIPGSIGLAFELIYEMTYLTWLKGPQMIGFSLMHAYTGFYIYFVLSLFALFAWILIVLFWSLKNIRSLRLSKKFILTILTAVITVILIFLPEGIYQRNTICLFGNSVYNHQFFIQAAGSGDFRSTRFYLKRDVDINCVTEDGTTALMAAAWNNQRKIVEFLISKGADLNKTANSQATALDRAVTEGHFELGRLLVDKGADLKSVRRFLRNDSIRYLTKSYLSRELISEYKRRDSLIILFINDKNPNYK